MEISPCPTCLILIKVINDCEIQIQDGTPQSRFHRNCLFKPNSSFMILHLKVTTSFKIMTGKLLAELFLILRYVCTESGGRPHLKVLEKNSMRGIAVDKVYISPNSRIGLSGSLPWFHSFQNSSSTRFRGISPILVSQASAQLILQ